jgi:ABC-type spermidine/putrescine transport system permease subunit I
MLPFYEWLAIALMVTFILSLFSGYPVAWLLAGLSLAFRRHCHLPGRPVRHGHLPA